MKVDKGPEVFRATFEVADAPIVLRADDGTAITPARRDELLQALHEGRHVALSLDIMPFRQRDGERNRNNVRFRTGGLRAMGRTGKGKPFLRDHSQGESLAVGGEILSSRMEPELVAGAEEWRLHQSVRLTAPWAVELALRDLIRFFSIGWNPTGAVLCTACGKDYFRECSEHWRGQVLEDGTVVELEYQDAELVETSCVPVPAVLGTHIESIRAALSAAGPNGAGKPRGENEMNLLKLMVSILGLAATAGDDEVVQAVNGLKQRIDVAEDKAKVAIADCDEAKAKLATATAELETLRSDALKRSEDEFIAESIKLGKLKPTGDAFEATLRTWFRKDKAAATELRDSRARVTPVGDKRQSDKADASPAAGLGNGDAALIDHGFNPDIVKRQLKQLGVTNPDELLNRRFGTPQEA